MEEGERERKPKFFLGPDLFSEKLLPEKLPSVWESFQSHAHMTILKLIIPPSVCLFRPSLLFCLQFIFPIRPSIAKTRS